MTPLLVLDCSAWMASFLKEECGREVDPLLDDALHGRARILAPAILVYELQNVLLVAMRRGRVTREDRDQDCRFIESFPLQTDPAPAGAILRRIRSLADEHQLSFYDAAYLEIAERFHARLKTFDRDLLALKPVFPLID